MKTRQWTVVVSALAMIATLSGCPRHKGPAERAGEKLDRAADKVEDAVDPKGPLEKAGRKIDRAVE